MIESVNDSNNDLVLSLEARRDSVQALAIYNRSLAHAYEDLISKQSNPTVRKQLQNKQEEAIYKSFFLEEEANDLSIVKYHAGRFN